MGKVVEFPSPSDPNPGKPEPAKKAAKPDPIWPYFPYVSDDFEQKRCHDWDPAKDPTMVEQYHGQWEIHRRGLGSFLVAPSVKLWRLLIRRSMGKSRSMEGALVLILEEAAEAYEKVIEAEIAEDYKDDDEDADE